jgi:hypothetical protein
MIRRTIYRIAAVATTTLAVLAAAAAPAGAVADPPTPTAQLNAIIGNITSWVVGLLIGVATLFLTIGGLRRMAAGGDPTEVEKSNTAFKNALFGYALAVLAPVLLGIVRGWIGG